MPTNPQFIIVLSVFIDGVQALDFSLLDEFPLRYIFLGSQITGEGTSVRLAFAGS